MTDQILCFYLPATAAGTRDLSAALDTATLSLRAAPDSGAAFTHVLLATGHTTGGPRRPAGTWAGGHVDLYLAARSGQPYVGEALLTQRERLEGRVLYPWRCGLRAVGSAAGVHVGALGDLGEALRLSGINRAGVTAAGHARTLPLRAGWAAGPLAFTPPTRQTRGLGAARSSAEPAALRDFAWTAAWPALRDLGYVDLGAGPLPGHRSLRAPGGAATRLYAHATPGSGAALPLSSADLAWLTGADAAALAVTRDAQYDPASGRVTGGSLLLELDWRPAPADLIPTQVMAAVPLP